MGFEHSTGANVDVGRVVVYGIRGSWNQQMQSSQPPGESRKVSVTYHGSAQPDAINAVLWPKSCHMTVQDCMLIRKSRRINDAESKIQDQGANLARYERAGGYHELGGPVNEAGEIIERDNEIIRTNPTGTQISSRVRQQVVYAAVTDDSVLRY